MPEISDEKKVKLVTLYSISGGSGSRSVNWYPFEGSQGPSLHHTMCTTEKWQASTGGLLHIAFPSSVRLVHAACLAERHWVLDLSLEWDPAGIEPKTFRTQSKHANLKATGAGIYVEGRNFN